MDWCLEHSTSRPPTFCKFVPFAVLKPSDFGQSYKSIRIDAVHYCELESTLADGRRRKSRLNRNAEPEDVPSVRLRLLCRTLREHQEDYGVKVQFLKVPYMTREGHIPDLARTVAVIPNARYIDLPEGVFTDDPSCHTLRQEIQARCPEIRKMTYMGGSEKSLELLTTGRVWPRLEVLELSKLRMDPTVLRNVLGSLHWLHALKISDMNTFNDELFQHNDYLPPFPAVTELIFNNIPNITAEGIASYLGFHETQDALKTLSLTATGVHPASLQHILTVAPRLESLSIIESVSTSFPGGNHIQPLSSKSLEILHYEISSNSSANTYASTTASYYTYLTSSLISNGLPNLRELYVRDPNFPESLIDLAPPTPAFALDPDNYQRPRTPTSPGFSPPNPNRFSSNNPFAKMAARPGLKNELVVYSKGLDEMEWNFSKVQPAKERGRRGSATAPRPISSYGLGENVRNGWGSGGGARQSVIVGNGFGGFLAVPAESSGRPSTSSGEKGDKKRGSQYDMWR